MGSDLLWSDPVMKKGTSESIRGIGTFFGPDVTQEFLGRDRNPDFMFKIFKLFTHSEIGLSLFPRLRDLSPASRGESRNLGKIL